MPSDEGRSSSREKEKRSAPDSGTETESAGAKRRRRTGWDSSPPAGVAPVIAGATPELLERQTQAASIAANMQMKASMSQLCRVYIGSLDYSLTEAEIREVFSAFGPIVNIDMPKEGTRSKGFCFVEYAQPESAEKVLVSMPGFNLKGRAIRVGRPTAQGGQVGIPAVTATTATSALVAAVPGVAAAVPLVGAPGGAVVNAAEAGQMAAALLLANKSAGSDQPTGQNRVYVGSVPYSFTADDVKQIFQVFGTIQSCQLIPSNERPGTHRGYGFIEFQTMDQAKLAIETMNGFEVAGKILKVNYATELRAAGPATTTPPSFALPGGLSSSSLLGLPAITQAAFSSVAAGLGGAHATSPSAIPTPPVSATGSNNIPVAPFPMLATAAPVASSGAIPVPPAPSASSTSSKFPSSNILLLTNMVDPKEANNDLKDEIQAECSKYGTIKNVEIVVNNKTADVRIFVVFERAQEAAGAVPLLHDRWFGGKKIHCIQYDPEAFAARRLLD